jgi:hypothetical protein
MRDGAGMRSSLVIVRVGLLVGSAAIAAAGCAVPQPIVRLEPRTAAHVVWVSGRAVLEKEKEGVRVAAAFEHQDGKTLGVRVEIENDTQAPFEVSPDEVTFMACPDTDNATCTGSWNVVDPEAALDALDEQQSRAIADARNRAGLDGTLVLLSATVDVAQIATGTTDAYTGTRTVALGASGEAHTAVANQQLAALADRRELWSNVALRRNTIAPGHAASGLVYIPIDLRSQYLWLHVRAGGQVFPFGFHQTVRKIRYDSTSAPSQNPG